MKTNTLLFLIAFVLVPVVVFPQVTVQVDLLATQHNVSPYLYGRNNSLSDNPSSPLSAAQWQKLKDAGVMFLRESGGNNSTKYNWRLKISSHPDWYNNVYAHDWDFAAKSLQQNMPSAQGMWSFQLIGKTAKTTAANFDDWNYNHSQWWEGVNQNLAGGGVPKSSGTKAQQEGNPDLYLENFPADSTTMILDHWFSANGIGLDKNKIRYWNMDNEVEIWNSTHDDIMPTQIPGEDFMQRYFEVAKKARAKFPGIRIVGPVTANEWQWYNYGNGLATTGNLAWLKFFIKRVGEEQKATGIRLLDVLDIHFYPGSKTASDVVQYHRVYFDKDYVFPEANGVHNVNGSWDTSQNKEYILQRCKEWLEQYIGPDHGVTFGVTETGIQDIGASAIAVWYAGTLGEFMRHPEMEIFTPWTWYPGMWEVLHLFSRYNKSSYVSASSSDEVSVSAYPTLNSAGDSLTVVLVNRSTSAKNVTVNFKGFVPANQSFDLLKLSGLSSGETFVSHQNNALQKSSVTPSNNALSVSLPSMSIVSVLLKGTRSEVVTGISQTEGSNAILDVFPNPASSHGSELKVVVNKTGNATLELVDETGKRSRAIYRGQIENTPFSKTVDTTGLPDGIYFLKLNLDGKTITRKVIR